MLQTANNEDQRVLEFLIDFAIRSSAFQLG